MIHPKTQDLLLPIDDFLVGTKESKKLASSSEREEESASRIITTAALQLAEIQIAQQRKVLKKCGFLRKHTGRRGTPWRFEKVELRYEEHTAWLLHTSVEDASLHQINNIIGGGRKNRRNELILQSGIALALPQKLSNGHQNSSNKEKKICLLRGKTHCHASDTTTFSLRIESDHTSLWMAASENERDEWIQAIFAVSEAADYKINNFARHSEDINFHHEDGPPPSYSSSYNIDLANFDAALQRAARAHDRNSFVHALVGSTTGDLLHPDPRPTCFRIPVNWTRCRPKNDFTQESINFFSLGGGQSPLNSTWPLLRKRNNMAAEEKNYHLKLPLSPHNPHAWTPDIVLNRFNQMRKDMRRDRVSINGQVIHAANEDYYESVAGILAQSILASAHTITKEHELATLTEASALVHASAILASGARTFSGGDAYACVHALCPGEHAVLCPLSTSASPLEISVSICQSSQPSVSRNDDDIKGHRRTKSDGTRAPHSSKETRAHRFIASFTSSPQRSESFSRTVSSPLTSSLASSHHNYPTMLEIALDEFQTNSQPIFNKNQPPRIDIALRATTDYKICTTNPQDLPSDTWLLVRAVWSRTFSIFGESTNGAHSFIASEPYVDIAIADAAFVPASVINNDDAFSDLFTS